MEIGPEPSYQGQVPFIAKATSFLIRLLSFSSSFKEQMQVALAVVGCGVGRVQMDGLIIGCQGLLVALESLKSNAFVVIGNRKLGLQLDRPLVSSQRLLVALQATESIPVFVIGKSLVRG